MGLCLGFTEIGRPGCCYQLLTYPGKKCALGGRGEAWDRVVCCAVLPATAGGEIARSVVGAFGQAEKAS